LLYSLPVLVDFAEDYKGKTELTLLRAIVCAPTEGIVHTTKKKGGARVL
jgi:hypothetical protein